MNKYLRPLSARSLVASVLLGTYPPRMPGRLMVDLGIKFGIAPGTVRVAISRMVGKGELVNRDGMYWLTGSLLERQQRQDRGRRGSDGNWDGDWDMFVVRGPARTGRDRAALRRALSQLRLAEAREGVWLRPANLQRGRVDWACETAHAQTDHYNVIPDEDPADMAARLWDLDSWRTEANELRSDLGDVVQRLEIGNRDALLEGFMLSAAVLRHFTRDPLLPHDLLPDGWPVSALRDDYQRYDARFRELLAAFFASRRSVSDRDRPVRPSHLEEEAAHIE